MPIGKASSTEDLTIVPISIKLDDELKNKLPAHVFLFVFALDVTGVLCMPTTVVTTRLTGLPITIELTNAIAMIA